MAIAVQASDSARIDQAHPPENRALHVIRSFPKIVRREVKELLCLPCQPIYKTLPQLGAKLVKIAGEKYESQVDLLKKALNNLPARHERHSMSNEQLSDLARITAQALISFNNSETLTGRESFKQLLTIFIRGSAPEVQDNLYRKAFDLRGVDEDSPEVALFDNLNSDMRAYAKDVLLQIFKAPPND